MSQPGASLSSLKAINFGLTYWSFSISLNIVVTALIVGRLLRMRYRLLSLSSGQDHSRVYISVSAMLIESAAFYSIVGIIFLVSYGLQSPALYIVESVELIQVKNIKTSCCSLLISATGNLPTHDHFTCG